jgi:GH25 family lysozyme M1 (1,4-beta-N-acetylmuramidase)
MIIKSPVCYDTSHWKIVPDFALVSPRPALVITKATECYPGAPFNNITDPTFARYFADLRQDGIRRGCYHFFRKAYDATRQARHFVETIRPHINANDILALDIEEGGETAAQILTFLDYLVFAYPSNIVMLYSRKNLLDPIPMTDAQKRRMKAFPVWVAGYPNIPDIFDQVPTGYIPDTSKYGPVWLWQYTEQGQVTGISGETDCNWIHPTLYDLISGSVILPPIVTPGEHMWYRVNATVLNIRNGPGASYTDNGDLLNGDVIEVSETLGGWHHFARGYRGTTPLILLDPAKSWCSSAYTAVTTAPVVEPPAEITLTHTIDVYSDGSIKVDGNSFE